MREWEIWHGDCAKLIAEAVKRMTYTGLLPVVVTDPPFNIGYHYKTYKDKMEKNDWLGMIEHVTGYSSSVIVLYPEMLHEISIAKNEAPERVVSWVYNSNTARQHRDIAYYGIKPDFNRVKQPYKNPNDKRIKERIAQGKTGAKLYDWWNVNQIKNVSKEKTTHPCQMPVEVLLNAIGILPDNIGVIDPFCGSGTTGVACKMRGIPFIGIELDSEYCRIAASRIRNV